MFKSVITPEMHYDDWAPGYDSDVRGWDYHAPDRVLEGVRPFLQSHPSAPRMLDVGIGTGLLTGKCRAVRGDLQASGIDVSAKMLALCEKKRLAGELRRVDVSRDVFPFADNSFDVVAASGVMENVSNISHAVGEMVRVARPGGLIALTFMPTTRHPVTETLKHKLRTGRTNEGRLVMGNLALYRHNPETVKMAAQKAGAQTESMTSFVGYRTYVLVTVRYELFIARKNIA